MVSGRVFGVNVVDHENDGHWLEQLERVDAEAFTDDFEKNDNQDVEVEEGEFFQFAILV